MNLTHRFVHKVLLFDSVSIRDVTEEDCQVARLASTNSIILTTRVVHLLACTLGIVSSLLFIFVLFSSKATSLHVNLRLSLISLSAAALLVSVQLVYIAIDGLVHVFSGSDACSFLVDVSDCARVRLPVVLGIYAILFGMGNIAVERLIATVMYRTYEVKGSWIVGGALIFLQWTSAILLSLLSTTARSDHGLLHYCTAYVSHPRSSVFSLSAMTIFELGTLIFYFTLLQINKYKQVNEFVNNALHSLTERYQLQENVRLMQALIPCVGAHAGLSLAGLIAMTIFAFVHSELNGKAIARFAPFSEAVMLVVPVYAVVLPTVAVARNKQLRVAARSALPCLFNPKKKPLQAPTLLNGAGSARTSKQVEEDGDTHFDILAEMWTK